jgi:anti-sigma-K factor RskA
MNYWLNDRAEEERRLTSVSNKLKFWRAVSATMVAFIASVAAIILI